MALTCSISYYIIGFEPSASSFFSFIFINCLLACISIVTAFLFSCIVTNVNNLLVMSPVVTVPFMLLAGLLVNLSRLIRNLTYTY